MFRVYVRGNYIYVEDQTTGKIYEGHRKSVLISSETSTSTAFRFQEMNGCFSELNILDVSQMLDETGSNYTVATFRTFVEENTGNFKNGDDTAGNGQTDRVINYFADDYTDLTTNVATSPMDGDIAMVRNAQGTSWLPFNLGGTYFPKGSYIYDGANWIPNTDLITQQLQLNIEDILEIILQTTPINTDTTLDYNKFYLVDATSGDTDVELPTAVGNKDAIIKIKKVDGTNNLVNVLGDIDGVANFELFGSEGQTITVQSDGTDWYFTQKTPRIYSRFDEVTQGLINQTTAFFDYHTFTVDIPATGTYQILYSWRDSINTTTNDIIIEGFYIDPALVDTVLVGIAEERQDAGGGGVVLPTTTGGTANTGTNQIKSQTKISVVNLFRGTYTFGIRYRGGDVNIEATIYNSLIKVMKL